MGMTGCNNKKSMLPRTEKERVIARDDLMFFVLLSEPIEFAKRNRLPESKRC
jgi:hypothetical protein